MMKPVIAGAPSAAPPGYCAIISEALRVYRAMDSVPSRFDRPRAVAEQPPGMAGSRPDLAVRVRPGTSADHERVAGRAAAIQVAG